MKVIFPLAIVCAIIFSSQATYSQNTTIAPTPSHLIVDSITGAYRMLDKKADFLEGNFYQFLAKNISYPKEAIKNKIEGTVIVQFFITASGEVREIKILKGIGYGCDEEAIRVIQLTNKAWSPGEHKGVKVDSVHTVPITFKI